MVPLQWDTNAVLVDGKVCRNLADSDALGVRGPKPSSHSLWGGRLGGRGPDDGRGPDEGVRSGQPLTRMRILALLMLAETRVPRPLRWWVCARISRHEDTALQLPGHASWRTVYLGHPMPRNRIYLHIGTQKTGTSSFQQYLTDQREALGRHGLNIITVRREEGTPSASAGPIGDAFLRPSLRTGHRMLHGRGRRGHTTRLLTTTRDVRAQIVGSNSQRHLVSAEQFCFARTPREERALRLLARACDAQIVPVLCLRNAEDWRRSWQAQVARMPYAKDLGEGTDNIVGDWYFDVDAIRAFWSRLGDVREVDYDAAVRAHGSVIPDLMSAVDGPYLTPHREYRLNRRP